MKGKTANYTNEDKAHTARAHGVSPPGLEDGGDEEGEMTHPLGTHPRSQAGAQWLGQCLKPETAARGLTRI